MCYRQWNLSPTTNSLFSASCRQGTSHKTKLNMTNKPQVLPLPTQSPTPPLWFLPTLWIIIILITFVWEAQDTASVGRQKASKFLFVINYWSSHWVVGILLAASLFNGGRFGANLTLIGFYYTLPIAFCSTPCFSSSARFHLTNCLCSSFFYCSAFLLPPKWRRLLLPSAQLHNPHSLRQRRINLGAQ